MRSRNQPSGGMPNTGAMVRMKEAYLTSGLTGMIRAERLIPVRPAIHWTIQARPRTGFQMIRIASSEAAKPAQSMK